MALHMGDYNELEVIRETHYAYILSDGEEEAFLHRKQTTRKLDLHEHVRVFLYYDGKKRVTATMNAPVVDQTRAAFCKVVEVSYRLGAFVDIGLVKDLLLSKDDLPFLKNEWPEVGDMLFVTMRVAKNQLTARLISRYEVKDHLIPAQPLKEGDTVTAYNLYKAEEGNVFFTAEGHYVFVYFKHMRKTYRLGEKTDITITIAKDDGTYNGTIIDQKETMIDKDAQRILDYLRENGGSMSYTDRTDPAVIQRVFHMSKSAFKRALGSLYKQQLIVLESTKTKLTDA